MAATVGSEPNRMYAKAVVVLVTTTKSPPPDKSAFDDTLPTDTLTVPVGRNGLTEPRGIAMLLLCRLADVFDDNGALVSGVRRGRDGCRIGGRIGRRTEAANPVPGLGDDLLQPVDRLAGYHGDAIDHRDDRIRRGDVRRRHAGKIALNQRPLPADHRAADHQSRQCRVRLDKRFGRRNEPEAEKVICHALLERLVCRGRALEELLEIRVSEKLPGGDRVQIAIVGAVDLRNRIQTQLGDRIEKI